MNKKFKVIQINGFSGLLLLGFVLSGLFFGFAVFPIWVIMNCWNVVITDCLNLPTINYLQAMLLWLAISIIMYLALRGSISFKIQKEESLEPDKIKSIIKDIKEKELEQEESRK